MTLLAMSLSAQTFDDLRVVGAGGKSITNWHGQADLQLLQVELGHSLSPRTTVAIVAGVANLWQPRSWFGDFYRDGNEPVRALTASVLVRHAWRPNARVRPYLETASGPFAAEKRVPASTSRFNFMTQAGGGLIFNAAGRMPVFAGYRLLHISNGGYSPRNPGLNVSAAVVGVQLRSAMPRQR
ncbi:MAG TPA: acyloxyacyl hydrolase [Thermoanaerobaculia bacterium]